MKKVFGFLAGISERRPWLVVLVVAAVTLFLGAGFPRVSTELSQEAMMPKHYKSVKTLDKVSEQFGGLSIENVLLVVDDAASTRLAKKLLDLTPEYLEEEGFPEGWVTKVETYLDALKQQLAAQGQEPPSNDIQLRMMLDAFLQSDYAKENVYGKWISEDGKAVLLKFQLDPDLTQNEEVEAAEKLEELMDREFSGMGAEIYISGMASMQKDSREFMNRETGRLFLAAFLFIVLILYLTFRRLSDILLPLFVIILAISWIIGLMGWAGITYTTMSVGIMPLMLGINIAYVIHVLSRYYEEREKGGDPLFSSTTAVKTVGVAVFLTAVTTMIGFSSFMITDIPPMRDFGLLCLLGIAFSFLLTVTLLPAVVVIRDRRKSDEQLDKHLEKMRRRRREARYGLLIDRSLTRMALLSERHHWWVALATVLLVAFGFFCTFNVETGADVRKMMPEDMPSRKASEMISEYFGPQNTDVILVEGDVLEPGHLEALLQMEDAIVEDPRNRPGEEGYYFREGISSIADYIAMFNPQGGIPPTREGVDSLLKELGEKMPLGFLIQEVSDGYYSAMVSIRTSFPEKEEEFQVKTAILRDHSREVEEETGMVLEPTGNTLLVADLLGNILPTQLKTSGLALLLCALVLIVVFKSLSYGLASLVVVVCGMLAEVIFLFALNWPLDLLTVMVASLVIGAGIDFGIHVTHRFREERQEEERDVEGAVRNTVLHVGRALVAAALTTCGVFAILGISSMVPMQRFGFTTAVGLVGALLGAVLVLPSLLAIIANREERKKAQA